MKNTIADLNNYLFEQIERLNDDELTDEQLEKEIRRSDAVGKIAKTIIDNGALSLQARKHFDDYGNGSNIEIPLLGITNKWLEEENQELKETVSNLRHRVKKLEDLQWDMAESTQMKKGNLF